MTTRHTGRRHHLPYVILAAVAAAVILGLIVYVVYEAAFTSHPRDCSALQGGAPDCIEGVPP